MSNPRTLCALDTNVSQRTLNQQVMSRLPTPSNKRPLTREMPDVSDFKKSRLDLSNGSDKHGSTSSRPTHRNPASNLRRSKSFMSLPTGSKQRPGASMLDLNKPSTKPTTASSRLFKAPSVASVSTAAKARHDSAAKAVSVPVTKSGKRPAWDYKSKCEDAEADRKLMQQTLAAFNERLVALEKKNVLLEKEKEEKEVMSEEISSEAKNLRIALSEKENKVAELQNKNDIQEIELKRLQSKLSSALCRCSELESIVENLTANQALITSKNNVLKIQMEASCTKITELEACNASQTDEIIKLHSDIKEKDERLRENETMRRTQHNIIQELKGNIRVFCRIRPLLKNEISKCTPINYNFLDQDHKSMEILASETIKGRNAEKYTFTFDKVFSPSNNQGDVFEEISHLVQSALDGYNVCVFAYGQTGSGKTYTMEGSGCTMDENIGMIPRAIKQIFQTIQSLQPRGWEYTMEATFLEVYNDTIRDLLGNPKDDLKHEIKMSDAKGSDVFVTNVKTVAITSQDQVYRLLKQAQNNRAVAATKCNDRSSRSHSIFQLCLTGNNSITTETSKGTLNLVDLAGSERLKESNAEGERLKETQKINSSLSNLGRVITAKSQNSDHIPYRSSKLTHLLMNSLSGNSKTLMFVNVSLKEEHLSETLNSLRFATKVNNCHIGTAQKKSK